VATALVAGRLSFVFYPFYRARTAFAIEPVSLVVPPGLGALVASTVVVFALALLVECRVRRRFQKVSLSDAFDNSVKTYSPALMLLPGLFLLTPGAPGVFPLVLFLALDARYWLVSAALGSCLALKLGEGRLPRPRRVVPALALLFLALVVLTPAQRFLQPYDERYGTGDEPRYVRIAASLLHDGDTDVSNAAENVGRRVSLERTARALASIPPAAFRTAVEAVAAAFGRPPEGEAASLGGQVVRGRKGGEFYVYLPGLPVLLLPAMALDSVVAPSYLGTVMLFSIALGALNAFAVYRLMTTVYPEGKDNLLVSMALALTPPLFAYSFQIYPEVTASICLSACAIPILRRSDSPPLRELLGFACGASLLPWLHTKYYSILGIVVLAFLVRHRNLAKTRLAVALGLPALAAGLQALYTFEITGSVLPDALWVLNGYPRGTHLFHAETPAGLHYLFLGASEGLLVYAPQYLFALLGLVALARQSRWAFGLSIAILIPHVLIAASHDEGGAGGWSPPSRYFVAVTPVLALGIAAWLSKRRSLGPMVLFAASFWIGLGMLEERNFLYDRAAFLGSGVVDPSALLRSSWLYPALLVSVVAILTWVERRRARGAVAAGSIALVVVLAGQVSRLGSTPQEWIRAKNTEEPRALKPGRSEPVLFRDCAEPAIELQGGESATGLRVRGAGFSRDVVVPSTTKTELDVSGDAFHQWTGDGSVSWQLFSLRPSTDGGRLHIEPFCRKGIESAR
jgi:hypothetical protein